MLLPMHVLDARRKQFIHQNSMSKPNAMFVFDMLHSQIMDIAMNDESAEKEMDEYFSRLTTQATTLVPSFESAQFSNPLFFENSGRIFVRFGTVPFTVCHWGGVQKNMRNMESEVRESIIH